MRRIRVMVGLIAAGMLAGCQPGNANRPPNVRFGEEACDSCRMIISDERFAAALVTALGDALKFDDIGCLIKHEHGQLRPEVTYWVRDFRGGEWLNARGATYVHAPSVVSPMGFGLAARRSDDAANESSAGLKERILSFFELPDLVAEESRGPESDQPKAKANEL
jgi:copper chaperone NosL